MSMTNADLQALVRRGLAGLIFALALLVQRHFVRGLTLGAVRG